MHLKVVKVHEFRSLGVSAGGEFEGGGVHLKGVKVHEFRSQGVSAGGRQGTGWEGGTLMMSPSPLGGGGKGGGERGGLC